jgi:hypothetical protein
MEADFDDDQAQIRVEDHRSVLEIQIGSLIITDRWDFQQCWDVQSERTSNMLTRFKSPACNGHHVYDMPETTVFATCSRTGKTLQLRLGLGGDVKATLYDPNAQTTAAADEKED